MAFPCSFVGSKAVKPQKKAKLIQGSPKLIIGGRPCGRVGDRYTGKKHRAAQGSSKLMVDGRPAHLVTHKTSKGHTCVTGYPKLIVGG